MMWSKAELENLALGGAEVAAERVMKHLSRPENADIFAAENFSYLWGALGVAGLRGTDAAARRKIWQVLKENGVPDAFEKGILGDFTRELAARHKDNRLRAWHGLDNFQAGIKFQKTILEKLAKYDKELEEDVLPYCFDYKKLIDELNVKELGGRLKAYLERLRGQGAACGISGDAVTAVYEKRAALRRLCDVAAYTQRRLSEAEKDYLFRYLREAAADGFAPQGIGLDDTVLSRLAADDALNGLSELEAAPLLARNAEIGEFAAGLEEEAGFCEETAAKLIRHEPGKIRPLTERCLHLIETGAAPKGVVFALALLELNQVKSAVRILLELAKKGRATEMCGFLHRLLPKAKGAETLIADMVRINLQNLPELPAKGVTASEHAAFRHYAAQRALCAARDFAETGCAVQAAVLLKFLVQEGWLAPDNECGVGNGGTQSLMREFIVLANTLAAADSRLAAEKLAARGKEVEAVSVMISGMTVANLLGIPMASYLTHIMSWHMLFAVVAAWGLFTIYAIREWVPDIAPLPATNFRAQFAFLQKPQPWLLLATIMLGNGGLFCWYSYINPIMVETAGFPFYYMAGIMMLAGLGMVLGNFVSGRLSLRVPAVELTMAMIGLMFLASAGILLLAPQPYVALALMFFGVFGLFGVSSPEQSLIIDTAKGGEILGASGAQVAFNLGNALGAYFGGLPIAAGYAVQTSAAPGTALCLLGLATAYYFGKGYRRAQAAAAENGSKTGKQELRTKDGEE